MTTNETATTILHQLGGAGRLAAMIGAHSFVGDTNSLIFKIKAKAAKSIKAVKVTLEPSDTYHVELYAARGLDWRVVVDHEMVHAEDLKKLVAAETGLCLTL